MKPLTIGELARRAGLGVETIRFYERRGLVRRPPRPATGYRRYPDETVARIGFIRQAQAVGFTLQEIAALLALRVAPGTDCAAVRARYREACECGLAPRGSPAYPGGAGEAHRDLPRERGRYLLHDTRRARIRRRTTRSTGCPACGATETRGEGHEVT